MNGGRAPSLTHTMTRFTLTQCNYVKHTLRSYLAIPQDEPLDEELVLAVFAQLTYSSKCLPL